MGIHRHSRRPAGNGARPRARREASGATQRRRGPAGPGREGRAAGRSPVPPENDIFFAAPPQRAGNIAFGGAYIPGKKPRAGWNGARLQHTATPPSLINHLARLSSPLNEQEGKNPATPKRSLKTSVNAIC